MSYLALLATATLPAAGNFLGGLLAESVRTPRWLVGAALHAAAGLGIAVVSIELVPRALEWAPPWLLAAAFVAGAAFSVLLAQGVERLRKHVGAEGAGSAGAWMVYVAIAADLFSDGLMTGTGSAISGSLGLLLAGSQLVANVPGGFASTANFRREGLARRKRFLVSASFPLPVLLSASLGFFALRGAGESTRGAALAFVTGVLLLATVEDTLPQADAPHPPRWVSTISFASGFALLVLVASYLG